MEVVILPNSSKERAGAIQDESEAILRRLKPDDVVILLDERGKNMSSPELSEAGNITTNNAATAAFCRAAER